MTQEAKLKKIKEDARVLEAYEDTDGCWIYLRDGFPSMEDPMQKCWTIHEDSWSAAYRKLNQYVDAVLRGEAVLGFPRPKRRA